MPRYGNARSNARNWFIHRITGTFLVFLLITHFWVQHYDSELASVAHQVITTEQAEAGELPNYPDAAQAGVRARVGEGAEVTPYDVVMQRLADPVYAVLWKAFNLFFLVFALHHGFYGLNNVMSDYIRSDSGKLIAKTLSWTLAVVLFIVGAYSVITAGWGYTPPM
ncbi:MAG: succinate dehydrogenase [Bacteroidetes bacterium]|jgi:succinate dehydrogenase / fumarate reductase membrane anchor subunit|nr:succinate dehydrogenase [Bacteroidota bacterium]